jgi:hypothetical protein
MPAGEKDEVCELGLIQEPTSCQGKGIEFIRALASSARLRSSAVLNPARRRSQAPVSILRCAEEQALPPGGMDQPMSRHARWLHAALSKGMTPGDGSIVLADARDAQVGAVGVHVHSPAAGARRQGNQDGGPGALQPDGVAAVQRTGGQCQLRTLTVAPLTAGSCPSNLGRRPLVDFGKDRVEAAQAPKA